LVIEEAGGALVAGIGRGKRSGFNAEGTERQGTQSLG